MRDVYFLLDPTEPANKPFAVFLPVKPKIWLVQSHPDRSQILLNSTTFLSKPNVPKKRQDITSFLLLKQRPRQTSKVTMFTRRAATNALRRLQRPQAGSSSLRHFSSGPDRLMYDVIPKDDFGEYSEYSVIFTNRALNLMSDPFQRVMRDLNNLLKETYNAEKVAIIPG